MRIGIIGAGFVGLTAAYMLAKKGHDVVVFEREPVPGGLATGFKNNGWRWPLEHHYHHLFTSDTSILNLARKIGHRIFFVRPKTSTLYLGRVFQLDSPLTLLSFPHLSWISKIRAGLGLFYLRVTNDWEKLERLTAKDFLIQAMGREVWRVLWEPLFAKKFGPYLEEISAAWFWARIKKRSASLGYPENGFQGLAYSLKAKAEEEGAVFIFGAGVKKIAHDKKKLVIETESDAFKFDRILCTLPSPFFAKLTPGLPKKYKDKLLGSKGVGAVNLVLALKKPFFKDGTYWLNVNSLEIPFLAIVEHTNMVDRKNYKGNHLLYVGNYVPADHPYFRKSAKELLSVFFPYLKELDPNLRRNDITGAWVFKAPFAQPIVTKRYSKKIPSLETPIAGVYLANIQQVYPWDRGTNYAVELGEKVAKAIEKDAEIY